MARMYPNTSPVRQSPEPTAGLAPSAGMLDTLPVTVISEPIDSSVDRNPPATAPPAPNLTGSSVGDQDDVMILEACADDVRHEATGSADVEVMFIG
jgi:hypothetical protein